MKEKTKIGNLKPELCRLRARSRNSNPGYRVSNSGILYNTLLKANDTFPEEHAQISTPKFRLSDFESQVPNQTPKFQISDFSPSFKFQASNSKFQIPNSKFQVPNFKFQVSSFKFRLFLIMLCIMSLTATDAYAQPPAWPEYRLKAAFIYNFARFVTWPENTFKKTDDSIFLCIVSDQHNKVFFLPE